MNLFRVVLHSAASMSPVLAFDWIFRFGQREFQELLIYGCGVVMFGLAVAVLASWFPLAVLIAVRNGGLAPGERPRIRRPVHPLGWITGFGVTAYIGVLLIGSTSSLPVSPNQLFAGLGVITVLLSWRYVAALPPRSERTQVH